MNWLSFKIASLPLTLAAFSAGSSVGHAGDAIIFSGGPSAGQSKPEAVRKETPRGMELLKPWDSLPSSGPKGMDLPSFLPSRPGPVGKSKQEKQLRAARVERQNWAIIPPGALQKKVEEKEDNWAEKSSDLLKAEELSEDRDYTFWGLTDFADSKDRSGAPGSDSKADDPNRRPATERLLEEEALSRQRKDSAPLRDKDGRELGAHASKALDLSGLFEFKSDSAREKDKSAFSLRELFGGEPAPKRSREQDNRMKEFKQLLAGPQSASLSAPWAEGLKPNAEAPRPSGGSTLPPPPSSARPGSGAFSPMPSLPSPAGTRNPFATGLPDLGGSRPFAPSQSPAGSGAFDLGNRPAQRSSVIRPTVLEIPQRKL